MPAGRRFLLATAEAHPTHRADVRVLFGEALPACGIATDLLALQEPGGPPRPWGGGKAILRSAESRIGMVAGDLLLQLSLFVLCFRGYDGLIVRDKPVLGLIGYLAARVARIPFCYWMSFPLPAAFLELSRVDDGSIGRARRLWLWARGTLGTLVLYRFLIHRADWLFVQSEVMERELRDIGLQHDRVTPVPMGVDADGLPPAAAELPEPLRGRRLGVYLGTLDRARKPELLVDAARIVAQRFPDFRLIVIGEADEPSARGWLKRYAESVGALDCVWFTGRIPFGDGIALARHAEVGLSPFPRGALLDSASPTKAVEYLACGVPVVCNDQPDQARLIERSSGGVVVPLDAQGFAAGICQLLTDPQDARRRAASGQEWVRRNRSYAILARTVADDLHALAGVRDAAERPTVGR
jgi:glycosyltransferase involved in cell wall biosynthesis